MLKFDQWKNLLVEADMDGFDKSIFKGAGNIGAERAAQSVQNVSGTTKTATGIVQMITRMLSNATPAERKVILSLVRRQLANMSDSSVPTSPPSMTSDLEQ